MENVGSAVAVLQNYPEERHSCGAGLTCLLVAPTPTGPGQVWTVLRSRSQNTDFLKDTPTSCLPSRWTRPGCLDNTQSGVWGPGHRGGVRCPGVPGAQQVALSGALHGPLLPSEAEGLLSTVSTTLLLGNPHSSSQGQAHRPPVPQLYPASSQHLCLAAPASGLPPSLPPSAGLGSPPPPSKTFPPAPSLLLALFHCTGHSKPSSVLWCLCALHRLTAFEVDTAWMLTIPGQMTRGRAGGFS